MERFVLNGSKPRTVLPLRFSKRNMLHFLCGAVAAQRLAMAMEHETAYLLARRARAAKQSHGDQSSSAVPSKCIHRGSRLRDFWQWEINNWDGEKTGTVQLTDLFITIWVWAMTVPMHLGLIKGPLWPIISYQPSGALLLAEVLDGPQT
jgi:hypothetical protein